MAKYLTYDEYKDIPTGIYVSEAEFGPLEYYSSLQIDSLTMGRIADATDVVKNAVAYQVAYLAQNGGMENVMSDTSAGSISMGSYSRTETRKRSEPSGGISPVVRSILSPTGLLYRGGKQCRLCDRVTL